MNCRRDASGIDIYFFNSPGRGSTVRSSGRRGYGEILSMARVGWCWIIEIRKKRLEMFRGNGFRSDITRGHYVVLSSMPFTALFRQIGWQKAWL